MYTEIRPVPAFIPGNINTPAHRTSDTGLSVPPSLLYHRLRGFVKNHCLLFRFTAVGGLVPVEAIITVGGRCPGGPWRVHSQPLEASALGADADVTAAACHDGRLLCQFVGEWL